MYGHASVITSRIGDLAIAVDWTTVIAAGVASFFGALLALIGVRSAHRLELKRQLVEVCVRLGRELRQAVDRPQPVQLAYPPVTRAGVNMREDLMRHHYESLQKHLTAARDLRWQAGIGSPPRDVLQRGDEALDALRDVSMAWWAVALELNPFNQGSEEDAKRYVRDANTKLQEKLRPAVDKFDEAVRRLNR